MALTLRHDRGTLVLWELPAVLEAHFIWDVRAQLDRAWAGLPLGDWCTQY